VNQPFKSNLKKKFLTSRKGGGKLLRPACDLGKKKRDGLPSQETRVEEEDRRQVCTPEKGFSIPRRPSGANLHREKKKRPPALRFSERKPIVINGKAKYTPSQAPKKRIEDSNVGVDRTFGSLLQRIWEEKAVTCYKGI